MYINYILNTCIHFTILNTFISFPTMSRLRVSCPYSLNSRIIYIYRYIYIYKTKAQIHYQFRKTFKFCFNSNIWGFPKYDHLSTLKVTPLEKEGNQSKCRWFNLNPRSKMQTFTFKFSMHQHINSSGHWPMQPCYCFIHRMDRYWWCFRKNIDIPFLR